MLTIYKLRNNPTVDFAALELQKYLRQMMPHQSLINIISDSTATDGFRLGLLEDFGLPNEAADPVLDDVVHIDTTPTGGILAGSNVRSVLFAVYRFLRLNGCRFLFPGAEGELIPRREALDAQSYHKLADHRIRGRTIEGKPSLEMVLSALDFYAKEELNSFGCYGVSAYIRGYYFHANNSANREKEFMDNEQAETQWRARFESEAKLRGMLLFTGEHDMIPHALGISMADIPLYRQGVKEFTQEQKDSFAMINGKRELVRNEFLYTNLCMSREDIREKMAQAVVAGIKKNPQIDVYGATVADLSRNHCECENCQKKRPSDFYMMIMNRVDELLTAENIPTRVLFSFYTDMIFAPETEKIKNPSRFVMQYCPISRLYTSSITENSVYPEPIPYIRNAWKVPKSNEELFALLKTWKPYFPGPYTVYEYHFWRHQYLEPGMQDMSRRLYQDVLSYHLTDMTGCVQDGSMQSYWPNAFHFHIFNEAMVNRDCDYEAEYEDFYRHSYGESWPVVREYLEGITKAFDQGFMEGEKSIDLTVGTHYWPEHAQDLARVPVLGAKIRAAAEAVKPETRQQYLAWRLLRYHSMYCEAIARVMTVKCQGDTPAALELFGKEMEQFGKNELLLERWFDFGLAVEAIRVITKRMPDIQL